MTRIAPKIISIPLLLLCALLAACAPAPQERTYSILVTNKLPRKITVFLTKNGPPLEQSWMTPEQLAFGAISTDNLIENFVVIDPGETAAVRNIKGKFDHGTSAILRVYERTGRLEDIVAMGPDDPRRAETILEPGDNFLIVDGDQNAVQITQGPPVNFPSTTRP